jgi:hypothetical protein
MNETADLDFKNQQCSRFNNVSFSNQIFEWEFYDYEGIFKKK